MSVKESDITICGHGSGHPSLKRLDNYCEMRYQAIAKNGKHKGIIEVRRLKALTSEGASRFVANYKTILGRNNYSQDLRQYVYAVYKDGKYYSDCSSSGMATFKRVGYNVPLLNTAGIHGADSLFETVKVKIKNGHITNPSKLKVGDCLLFVGNDPSRPLQIGHVEYVYAISGKRKKRGVALPTLRKGDKGREVKLLQKNLNKVLPALEKLVVDGQFGEKTEAKLKKFQRKYQLVADGIYGIMSANKMCDVIEVL